jgi:transcriptional regulator with XRE-family HTH domain
MAADNMTEIENRLSDNVKYLILYLNMTQSKFADFVKVGYRTIDTWESKRNRIKIAQIIKISTASGISIDDLCRSDLRSVLKIK